MRSDIGGFPLRSHGILPIDIGVAEGSGLESQDTSKPGGATMLEHVT